LRRIAANPGTPWLVAGAWLSFAASALHIGCILGGPAWYRFFGAGEGVAQAAERGEWLPTLLTLAIAAVLALWGAYALSGAGRIVRLPLPTFCLVGITAVYLLRGLILIPLVLWRPELVDAFAVWSSLIVLAYGLVHAVGLYRAWPALRARA